MVKKIKSLASLLPVGCILSHTSRLVFLFTFCFPAFAVIKATDLKIAPGSFVSGSIFNENTQADITNTSTGSLRCAVGVTGKGVPIPCPSGVCTSRIAPTNSLPDIRVFDSHLCIDPNLYHPKIHNISNPRNRTCPGSYTEDFNLATTGHPDKYLRAMSYRYASQWIKNYSPRCWADLDSPPTKCPLSNKRVNDHKVLLVDLPATPTSQQKKDHCCNNAINGPRNPSFGNFTRAGVSSSRYEQSIPTLNPSCGVELHTEFNCGSFCSYCQGTTKYTNWKSTEPCMCESSGTPCGDQICKRCSGSAPYECKNLTASDGPGCNGPCSKCVNGSCVPTNEGSSCGTCHVCQGGTCTGTSGGSCGTCGTCSAGTCNDPGRPSCTGCNSPSLTNPCSCETDTTSCGCGGPCAPPPQPPADPVNNDPPPDDPPPDDPPAGDPPPDDPPAGDPPDDGGSSGGGGNPVGSSGGGGNPVCNCGSWSGVWDGSWTPATSTVCSGETFTQSNSVTYTRTCSPCPNQSRTSPRSRTATGTKNCGDDDGDPVCNCGSWQSAGWTGQWSPRPHKVCSGEKFTQHNSVKYTRTCSPCPNESRTSPRTRQATGTKNCDDQIEHSCTPTNACNKCNSNGLLVPANNGGSCGSCGTCQNGSCTGDTNCNRIPDCGDCGQWCEATQSCCAPAEVPECTNYYPACGSCN